MHTRIRSRDELCVVLDAHASVSTTSVSSAYRHPCLHGTSAFVRSRWDTHRQPVVSAACTSIRASPQPKSTSTSSDCSCSSSVASSSTPAPLGVNGASFCAAAPALLAVSIAEMVPIKTFTWVVVAHHPCEGDPPVVGHHEPTGTGTRHAHLESQNHLLLYDTSTTTS